MTNDADAVDTSNEACAVICMLVSNPQGVMRKDGDGWQRRVNDLIRALRDERNMLRVSQPGGEEIREAAAAYRVEPDVVACPHCGLGERWNVVGPDDIAISVTFDDEGDADDTAAMLSHAYLLGVRSLSSGSNKSDDGKKGQPG